MNESAKPPEILPLIDGVNDNDLTLFKLLMDGPVLTQFVEKATGFLDSVRNGYIKDPLFQKIIANISHYSNFYIQENLVYTRNKGRQDVLCIPRVKSKGTSLTATIIDQAHTTLGHFASQKTAEYIRRWYWWPKLGYKVTKYCDSCGVCQTSKVNTQRPVSLLHMLPIPNHPWGSIGMDFVGPFPESHGYDYLWVIICRLTSMVHLVPLNTTTKVSELAWL